MKLFFNCASHDGYHLAIAENEMQATKLLLQSGIEVKVEDLEELPLKKPYVLRFVNEPSNRYMIFGYTQCVKATEFLFRCNTVDVSELEDLVTGWLEANSPGTPWFHFDELQIYDIVEYRWFTIQSCTEAERSPRQC